MDKLKILLLLLFIPCALAQGQIDTTSSGDPNDPNCPCYVVQQQAEQEYQQMMMQQRKVKEDSMLALHRKDRSKMNRRMKQNHKRKRRNECPQSSIINTDFYADQPRRAFAVSHLVGICGENGAALHSLFSMKRLV